MHNFQDQFLGVRRFVIFASIFHIILGQIILDYFMQNSGIWWKLTINRRKVRRWQFLWAFKKQFLTLGNWKIELRWGESQQLVWIERTNEVMCSIPTLLFGWMDNTFNGQLIRVWNPPDQLNPWPINRTPWLTFFMHNCWVQFWGRKSLVIFRSIFLIILRQ